MNKKQLKSQLLVEKIMDEINKNEPVVLTTEIKLTGIEAAFYRALKVAQETYSIIGINLDTEIFNAGIHEMLKRIWTSYSMAFLKGMQSNNDENSH